MGIARSVSALVTILHALASTSLAHSPHDEVRGLALSTIFGQDGVAFAVARLPPAPHAAALLRTMDGGLSWKRMWKGLDYRGEVTSVCVSPNFAVDTTVFATTDSDGAYLSRDKGYSWTRIGAGMPFQRAAIAACAVDRQSNPVLVVAGVFGGAARFDGVSWTELVDSQTTITALAVSPTVQMDGLIVAGSNQGKLFFSSDHGAAWGLAAILPGAGRIHEIALTSAGATAYVATDALGLVRTTDGAKSFTPVDQGLPPEPITALALSPSFDQDQTVFTATGNAGVFKSTDGGSSWTSYQTGIVLDDDAAVQTDYHYQTIAVSNDFVRDETVFVTMFEGIFRSVEGGVTWFPLETNPLSTILGVAISPSFATDSTLALTRYGSGASISVDGAASWVPANQGIESPFLYDIAFSPEFATDRTLFVASPQYLTVKSDDVATSWNLDALFELLLGNEVAISPAYATDRTVFLGTRSHGLFRTTNGGASWRQAFFDHAVRIDSLVISPGFSADATVFAGRPSLGVLKSTDGGASWQTANNGLPLDNRRGPILKLSPDFPSDRKVWSATLTGIYESTDGGGTWSALAIDGIPPDSPVEEIGISPAFPEDQTMLASVRGRGLFKSTDGGGAWSEIAPELIADHELLQSIRFSPAFATDQTLLGHSSTRLFRSTDGGNSWENVDHGPVRHENSKPENQWLSFEGSGQGVEWPSASASRITWLQTTGSLARFFFNGRGVSWLGARAPFLGIGEVYLDGILQAEVDQYGPTPEALVTLFAASDLTPGFHELEIVVSGRKNPLSSNIGAAVDAIDVIP